MVGYQLDRLTPFSADAAYYDARVVRYDKARKSVIADIYVTPKAALEKVFSVCRQWGYRSLT
ncbi:MAG: hypothetical protein R3E89_01190 [Thiolinea sp.]